MPEVAASIEFFHNSCLRLADRPASGDGRVRRHRLLDERRSHAMPLWLLACVILSSSAPAFADSLAGSRPNIVLIMTDDQGYAPVGRHGHPWIETPHLDRLYDSSVRFTRFLVSPTCSPTRSALMTGRHPMRNGVTHTILERERMTLSAVTLPQVLKTAGYTTGMFGKWHLGDEEPYQPQNRGFDETFIHGAGGNWTGLRLQLRRCPGQHVFRSGDPPQRLVREDAGILHGRLLHRRPGVDQAVSAGRESTVLCLPGHERASRALPRATREHAAIYRSRLRPRSGRVLRHDREHRRKHRSPARETCRVGSARRDADHLHVGQRHGRKRFGTAWTIAGTVVPMAARCCPTTPA